MSDKKKMSIFLYSLAAGGAERVAATLINRLEPGYDITLFLMRSSIFYDLPKDIRIVYLEDSDPRESGIMKLLKLPLLAWRYKRYNDAPVSLSFMNRPNYVNVLAKLFGMRSKVIVSERSTPSQMYGDGSLQSKINRFLIRALYAKADVVTSNSLGNSRDLEEHFGLRGVVTLNNLFDLERIGQLSQELVTVEKKRFTFITVGRLDANKNHRLLIDAVRNVDADLWIIGDGELRSSLEQYISESGLEDRVVLLGQRPNPFAYISKADCFVFSSLHEGFPNVLVEALACGLPVISTDCPNGPREILAPSGTKETLLGFNDGIERARYGILVPNGNEIRMTEAMELIAGNMEMREEYGNRAGERSRDYGIENIIHQYEELINS